MAYVGATLGLKDLTEAGGAGLLTMLRVLMLIAVASLMWVPIGVWIGLRPWAAERVQRDHTQLRASSSVKLL